ncbi:exodeoxyribonuclease VII large subunit [Thermaerobacter sp. PB12/4term]|uniref:exodeoxyribonuclease VII large subunit n=1 Tax=Thermaerobacter sp. PB12/4term TaxID=2293838 RepID=UPI000E3250EC|nr:exodeoxyribonuclease VII large subunit [Thermaerobacter sp. PB12/4term]QIA27101.1 exodeoxyribonuclease VII large subunit [Thermaerobacter sp. PB12/4term]
MRSPEPRPLAWRRPALGGEPAAAAGPLASGGAGRPAREPDAGAPGGGWPAAPPAPWPGGALVSGGVPAGVLTVSELTARIRLRLESDARLRQVWVRGEVNSCKRHSSGHLYFTLQDEGATLRCVMFRSAARHLGFTPEDGMEVLALGRVGVYEPAGTYQLYVETLEPAGLGALYLALEQRRQRLAREGLFDPGRKRPLPAWPRCIGVITSADGAALRDILKVALRRNPRLQVVVAPVPVQGEGAAQAIAEAIRRFNRWGRADVLIVGRGGGAREDLWAFNEEEVVRAVAASRIPVISAVGHEVDVTLCDLAADVRAPTPSAAAELAAPELAPIERRLAELSGRLEGGVRRRLERARRRLEELAGRPGLRHPAQQVAAWRQRLERLRQDLARAAGWRVAGGRQRLGSAAGRLEALSPLSVLRRGYSITRTPDGRVVTWAGQVRPGDRVEVLLARGRLDARVLASWPGEGTRSSGRGGVEEER